MGPVQEPVRSGMAEAAPRPCGDAAEPDGAEAVQPQTSTAAISAMNASMVFIRQNLCRRQDKGLDEGTLKHRVGLPCEGGPKALSIPRAPGFMVRLPITSSNPGSIWPPIALSPSQKKPVSGSVLK